MYRRFMAGALTVLVSVGLLWAHGDATHIMGTITAVQGDHVTVKLQDGKSEMVMLDKATKYRIGTKAATKADLKVSARVVIDATMDEKTKMYVASEVRIGVVMPPATNGNAKAAAPAATHAGH